MEKQEGEDMISGKDLEFYEQEEPTDQEIKDFMDDEIAHVPQAPGELTERLSEHHSTSPADSRMPASSSTRAWPPPQR